MPTACLVFVPRGTKKTPLLWAQVTNAHNIHRYYNEMVYTTWKDETWGCTGVFVAWKRKWLFPTPPGPQHRGVISPSQTRCHPSCSREKSQQEPAWGRSNGNRDEAVI